MNGHLENETKIFHPKIKICKKKDAFGGPYGHF
jgi:hypothetical protein